MLNVCFDCNRFRYMVAWFSMYMINVRVLFKQLTPGKDDRLQIIFFDAC